MPTRRISEKRKIEEGRGKGLGKDYKPWIRFAETSSLGTGAVIPDWKHGRGIQCLSQGEIYAYALLRWDDNVEDILEQYPLKLDLTNEIAFRLGYSPSDNGRSHMTTDFVVIYKDKSIIAYSIKAAKNALKELPTDSSQEKADKQRKRELQEIEEVYWECQSVPRIQWFTDEMDRIKAQNILDVTAFICRRTKMDDIAIAKYLIANKVIEVDMSKKIDYQALVKDLKEKGLWKALKAN